MGRPSNKPQEPASAAAALAAQRQETLDRSPVSLPCPACGFLTVPDAYFGSYNICSVCGWEDDGVQLANPACGGGANSESLIDAQATALTEFPLGRPDSSGSSRDSAWRPLSDDEIKVALREREERHWRNNAVVDLSGAYWTRLSNKA